MTQKGWNVLVAAVVTLVVTLGVQNNLQLQKQDGDSRTGNVVMLVLFGGAWVYAAIRIAEDQ